MAYKSAAMRSDHGRARRCRGLAIRFRRSVDVMDAVASSFDGLSVAFEVSGSGPPAIIFIHGLVGDHTDFATQVDYFAPMHQVVAIDLPGSGESEPDRSTWSMEAFGEDVATVVDHLGLDDIVLVGHSLGGNVAVEAALRLPGRVRGLVWVSTVRSLDSVRDVSQMDGWFAPFSVDFVSAMDDLIGRNFGPNADPGVVEAVAAKAREADQARVMSLLKSKFNHGRSIVDALSRIDVPVFAINPDFKPNDEASFARNAVELRIIPGVGHFVMLEDPETFTPELADIIRRLD